jgi:hypothetical protein
MLSCQRTERVIPKLIECPIESGRCHFFCTKTCLKYIGSSSNFWCTGAKKTTCISMLIERPIESGRCHFFCTKTCLKYIGSSSNFWYTGAKKTTCISMLIERPIESGRCHFFCTKTCLKYIGSSSNFWYTGAKKTTNEVLHTYYISMHFMSIYISLFYVQYIIFLRDVMGRVRVPLTIFLERFPIRKKVSGTHAIPHMSAHEKSFQNENEIHISCIFISVLNYSRMFRVYYVIYCNINSDTASG